MCGLSICDEQNLAKAGKGGPGGEVGGARPKELVRGRSILSKWVEQLLFNFYSSTYQK